MAQYSDQVSTLNNNLSFEILSSASLFFQNYLIYSVYNEICNLIMIFLVSSSNDRRKQILAKLIEGGDWYS
jgi:hypothetical protein